MSKASRAVSDVTCLFPSQHQFGSAFPSDWPVVFDFSATMRSHPIMRNRPFASGLGNRSPHLLLANLAAFPVPFR
ncbi:hypothetical protein WS71_03600 [Burkholderia mayonis]|uniref:Uncharacterized protein n=1 Tax=Burkholderia mayonis TaxID=1385591 RepID=A0A1B4FS64_9BURK|nr:hypothetical protein WS71_03600 [Burkholderia mayonis]KVE51266.1 hypothetical protein WS71_13240 [Burkholderia mayonis]